MRSLDRGIRVDLETRRPDPDRNAQYVVARSVRNLQHAASKIEHPAECKPAADCSPVVPHLDDHIAFVPVPNAHDRRCWAAGDPFFVRRPTGYLVGRALISH